MYALLQFLIMYLVLIVSLYIPKREYKKSEKKGIRVDVVNTVVIHIGVVK